MSRRPVDIGAPKRSGRGGGDDDRKKRAKEHAHAIRNLPKKGKELKKYLEERKAKRARDNIALKQAAAALAKATLAFKREDVLATRALQAKQRRATKKIKATAESAATKEEEIAAVRSRIARDPQRSAAIERLRARRRRILESVYKETDLGDEDSSDDEEDAMSEEEDDWLAFEDDGFNVSEEEYMGMIAGGAVGRDVTEADIHPDLRAKGIRAMSEADREARAVIRRARAALPPISQKISEKEFQIARMRHDQRVALATGEGGGAGLLPGGAGAGPAPSKRRVALQTVAPVKPAPPKRRVALQAVAPVNPHFYVPEPAPPDEKEELHVNELRTLTPDDIVELLIDVEAEIEERERGSRGVDGRWDLSGFNAETLVRIREHVLSMQEMFLCGLISTEAAPQKATGIGAMFRRLFF